MLTRKGRATGGASLVLLAGGLVLANPVLLAAGAAALLLLAATSLLLRHARVTAVRHVSSGVLNEEQEVTVRVEVKPEGRGRVFAEIRDRLPPNVDLSAGSNYALVALAGPLALEYRILCPVKGRILVGPLTVRLQDPFGFWHKDVEVPGETVLTVYPRVYDLKDALVRSKFPLVVSGDYQVGNPGLGTTFFALREYQVGDSIRSINWKASARSTKLVVNQTERESQARATFVLDARAVAAAGTPRRNPAVYSARAAASVARFILRRRDRVRLFLYGNGVKEVDPKGEKQDIILNEALAAAGTEGASTLLDAVNQFLPTLRRRSPVVVFTSLLDDPSVEQAVQALRAYEANVVVISPDPMSCLAAAGLAPDDTGYDAAKLERDETIAVLKGYGAWVINWPPDEPLAVTFAREMA